jgi:F420-dependent oxidoreductase-like protein
MSPHLKFRVFTEPQQGASHADLAAVAITAEQQGFDGFFRSDHYLSMGSASGLPGPSDAWLSLAALAVQTTTIRLGTLVTPITFRLPGPLALCVAQVDEMSGGRVELGLGAGWYEAEHAAYGVPFPPLDERYARFAEQVAIIHGMWTTPQANTFSFAGDHYTLNASPALPKPVQRPHPPLIIGGKGQPKSARIAALFGDEYNVSFRSAADTAAILGNVSEASRLTGRSLIHSVVLVLCLGRNETEVEKRATAIDRDKAELRVNGLAGTPQEVRAKLDAYAEIGVTRFYLQMLDLSDLDQLELFASEVMPAYR